MKIDLSTAVAGDRYKDKYGITLEFSHVVPESRYPYRMHTLDGGTRSYTCEGKYFMHTPTTEDLARKLPVKKLVNHKHAWTPIGSISFGMQGRRHVCWCSTCGALSFKPAKGKCTYLKVKRAK